LPMVARNAAGIASTATRTWAQTPPRVPPSCDRHRPARAGMFDLTTKPDRIAPRRDAPRSGLPGISRARQKYRTPSGLRQLLQPTARFQRRCAHSGQAPPNRAEL
jgi:hypothetical protein